MSAQVHLLKNDSVTKANDLNLYQKLVQVRREVKYVKKDAKGFNFSYASESQILGAIRGKMDELNVFLESDMISLEPIECVTIQNKVPTKVGGLRAVFEFTWTNADNPSEIIKKKMILQDVESGIETVGSLMTYANRYFLYKFFSVPTDKEDPDAFENKVKKTFDSNDSQLDVSSCEKVEPVKTASFKEILEIEQIIDSQITPHDPEYKKRAMDKLSVDTLSKITLNQAEVLRKNMAKKIAEIAANSTEN